MQLTDSSGRTINYLRPPNPEQLAWVLEGIVTAKPEGHDISCNGYGHKNFSIAQIGG